MYTCILIDNNSHININIKKFISNTSYLRLCYICSSFIEASSYLRHESIDVIFLNVKTLEASSIEFIRKIEGVHKVIVATDYPEYVLECYEYGVLDYLLAPVSFDRYIKAICKINASSALITSSSYNNNDSFMFFKTQVKGKLVKIDTHDIYYIEGQRNYLSIFTKDKKIVSLLNMKDVEKKLPISNFMRIHKSYIINVNKIEFIEGSQIILKRPFVNQSVVPIGVTYRRKFYQKFEERILGGE